MVSIPIGTSGVRDTEGTSKSEGAFRSVALEKLPSPIQGTHVIPLGFKIRKKAIVPCPERERENLKPTRTMAVSSWVGGVGG